MTLGGNILGNILSARHDFKTNSKRRIDQITRRLDLVSRSEFDAAFGMLAKARVMQELLDERLVAIEAKIGVSSKRSAKNEGSQGLRSVKKKAHGKRGA